MPCLRCCLSYAQLQLLHVRGSFKKYVDFYHNFFSRCHIILRFGTHIWTTNSVDLKEKFLKFDLFFFLENNQQNVSVKWSHGARFDCVVYDIYTVED